MYCYLLFICEHVCIHVCVFVCSGDNFQELVVFPLCLSQGMNLRDQIWPLFLQCLLSGPGFYVLCTLFFYHYFNMLEAFL